VIAVFAKAPDPGRVKTRLSPALRPDEAADLYRALLLDTIEVVESAGARLFVAFTPPTSRRPLERLLGSRRRLLPQPPGDLGARLEGVLERLQAEAGPRAIVVGSDCPGLTPERLREAWDALGSKPVVVGPARDGGFYLLGLSAPQPGLLRGIPWSTGGVLDATRGRAHARGLAIHELPPERDLDTPDDLFELFAAARTSKLDRTYPRTWKILHAIMTPRRFSELESRLLESRRLT
jgi:rSAM/selenodomain-associated transferase 1